MSDHAVIKVRGAGGRGGWVRVVERAPDVRSDRMFRGFMQGVSVTRLAALWGLQTGTVENVIRWYLNNPKVTAEVWGT